MFSNPFTDSIRHRLAVDLNEIIFSGFNEIAGVVFMRDEVRVVLNARTF